jgi:hypothetical protein
MNEIDFSLLCGRLIQAGENADFISLCKDFAEPWDSSPKEAFAGLHNKFPTIFSEVKMGTVNVIMVQQTAGFAISTVALKNYSKQRLCAVMKDIFGDRFVHKVAL